MSLDVTLKPFTIGLGVCEQTEFGIMLIFHDVSSIFQKGGGFNLSSILSKYLVRHKIWTLEKRDTALLPNGKKPGLPL